jgi:hypothetical protein
LRFAAREKQFRCLSYDARKKNLAILLNCRERTSGAADFTPTALRRAIRLFRRIETSGCDQTEIAAQLAALATAGLNLRYSAFICAGLRFPCSIRSAVRRPLSLLNERGTYF